MNRRNMSEVHQLELTIHIPHIKLNLPISDPFYLTSKVGKCTSKEIELQSSRDGLICPSPLGLDLEISFDKQKDVYDDKEILIILTYGNRRSIAGMVSLNLHKHMSPNQGAHENTSSPHNYRFQGCHDKHSSLGVLVEYKVRNIQSNGSLQRAKQEPPRNAENIGPMHEILNAQSYEYESLSNSIIMQQSMEFEEHSEKSHQPYSLIDKLKSLCELHEEATLSFDQSTILQNLSVITNQCNILRSMMNEAPNSRHLQQQNTHLKETKQHMKNQIQSLQYLNGVLLQQQSNKDRQIQQLQKELQKAYSIINKFKGAAGMGMVEDLKSQIRWLREAKQVADEEIVKMKKANEVLLEESRTKEKISSRSTDRKVGTGLKEKEVNILKANEAMQLSLEFNKLKERLIKRCGPEDLAATIQMVRPLQRRVQELSQSI